MRIRLAAASEYDAIGDLTAAAYVADGHVAEDHDYVDQLRDTATRAAQAEVWVAVDGPDDRLLGTVTNCPAGSSWREVSRDGEGEFRMLAVAREARGRGVGSALVEHCIEEARSAGRASARRGRRGHSGAALRGREPVSARAGTAAATGGGCGSGLDGRTDGEVSRHGADHTLSG